MPSTSYGFVRNATAASDAPLEARRPGRDCPAAQLKPKEKEAMTEILEAQVSIRKEDGRTYVDVKAETSGGSCVYLLSHIFECNVIVSQPPAEVAPATLMPQTQEKYGLLN